MLRSAEPAILKPTEHIVNSQTSGAYLICQSQKVGGGGQLFHFLNLQPQDLFLMNCNIKKEN